MEYLLKVAIGLLLLVSQGGAKAAVAKEVPSEKPMIKLEKVLNSKNFSGLKNFFPNSNLPFLKSRYRNFLNQFPDAKWSIKKIKSEFNGETLVEVIIKGKKITEEREMNLFAKQILALKNINGELGGTEIKSEYSIIQSSHPPIPITINIPDSVLTGARYDLDIIIDKPLGDAILAGGIIAVSKDQIHNQISPLIELIPLSGGGIFKSTNAPLKPGVQNWAAVIAHPEGLISITKMVKIVQ